MAEGIKRTARPRLACEILPDRVVAGRVSESRDFVEAYGSQDLAPGTIAPSLSAGNVLGPDALREAIAGALAAVGRGHDVTAIVPDGAVRLFLLDFDELPDKPKEADPVVRFRLRKSLPFDVEKAAVSFDVRRENGTVKVLAAVTLSSVLEEYEAAFRQAGYSPGVVMPSMVAALGPVDAIHPTLVLKVDASTIMLAILDREELRLLRTLENAHGAEIAPAQLADEIYPSLIFYQDTYGAAIERILVAGFPAMEKLGAALESHSRAKVEPLVTGRYLGASVAGETSRRDVLAGIVGALVG